VTTRDRLLLSAALALVVAPVALVPVACDRRPPATKPANSAAPDDPLADVRDAARKEHDLESCKNIIAQLNEYLRRSEGRKPAALTPAERDLLAKQLNLTDEEIAEAARDEFSPLDAHYLEECFILHDAVTSLGMEFADTSEAAQLGRAKRAFAWAMRQLWRREFSLPFIPPGYVLKRGSGSTPERTAVTLALFQVLGLDACLVGKTPPGAAPQLWAVGVRLDRSVYLFDPHTGVPLTKPDGKGVYTLAEVKADPDLIKALSGQFTPPVTPKELAGSSELYLAPTLSAVAPRMRFLRETLGLAPPLVCGVDPVALAASFAQTGEKVSFWNPPKPATAPVRTSVTTPVLALAYFLPPAEGGFDRAAASDQALEAYKRDLVPPVPLPPLLAQDVISGPPATRLLARFLTGLLAVQEVRPQVLRGQFDEAVNTLVERLTTVDRGADRAAAAPDLDRQALDWCRQMSTAFAAQRRAEVDVKPVEAQEARDRVERLWNNAEKILMYLDRAAAPPVAAALTYELALCKHEQAERLAHRPSSDASAAREAWTSAGDWWNKYLTKTASKPWVRPTQTAHAKALLAEARREAAKPSDQ
jgi:hypothetical protein